ncbi:MAG: hypothetical protein P4L33_06525 [Capsulimonadaceae bacterium]|nr:hypothetical protein [Capsulimonadaceae bacterium]
MKQVDPLTGREAPADCLIEISHDSDRAVIFLPPRKLSSILRLLLALNVGSVLFIIVMGVLYMRFHVALFTGLPDPSTVFSSPAARMRWLWQVATGWIFAIGAMVAILGLVWIPQISTESIELNHKGIAWRRDGWWKHETLQVRWNEMSDILVEGRMPDIAQNRLVIRLFDGRERSVAESVTNSEREWLEFVIARLSPLYRGI